eukprot:Transcript_279.p1 GENE.Transcript_279~~Transcript_279.p1  ORF type:complete len:289 (-),score=34.10 Transcript_279:56-922(-)
MALSSFLAHHDLLDAVGGPLHDCGIELMEDIEALSHDDMVELGVPPEACRRLWVALGRSLEAGGGEFAAASRHAAAAPAPQPEATIGAASTTTHPAASSTHGVAAWLVGIGLGELSETLEECGITLLADLQALAYQDLEALGISGARLSRLWVALGHASPAGSSTSHAFAPASPSGSAPASDAVAATPLGAALVAGGAKLRHVQRPSTHLPPAPAPGGAAAPATGGGATAAASVDAAAAAAPRAATPQSEALDSTAAATRVQSRVRTMQAEVRFRASLGAVGVLSSAL